MASVGHVALHDCPSSAPSPSGPSGMSAKAAGPHICWRAGCETASGRARTFSRAADLRRHEAECHGAEPKHFCDHEGCRAALRGFQRPQNLHHHLWSQHDGRLANGAVAPALSSSAAKQLNGRLGRTPRGRSGRQTPGGAASHPPAAASASVSESSSAPPHTPATQLHGLDQGGFCGSTPLEAWTRSARFDQDPQGPLSPADGPSFLPHLGVPPLPSDLEFATFSSNSELLLPSPADAMPDWGPAHRQAPTIEAENAGAYEPEDYVKMASKIARIRQLMKLHPCGPNCASHELQKLATVLCMKLLSFQTQRTALDIQVARLFLLDCDS